MTTVRSTNFMALVFVSGQGKCLWSHNGSIATVYIPTGAWRYLSQTCTCIHVIYPYENCNFPDPNSALRWKTWDQDFFLGETFPSFLQITYEMYVASSF
jgi:hypothetical protein